MNKLAVVVTLYQKKFSETPSADLLITAAEKNELLLIIYDNSQETDNEIQTNKSIIYTSHPENKGICPAYNFALQKASELGADWLILLDHDTKVSDEYLSALLRGKIDGFKAVVPQIFGQDTIISPLLADRYISLNDSQSIQSGQTEKPIMAINSGSAVPVDILQSIGGFNEAFPLDFLDHWLFWRLNQIDQPYLILETQLKHSLSVQTPSAMSTTRYASILAGEALYYSQYNLDEFSNYRKHLMLRSAKQFLKFKNRQLWRMSLKTLIQLRRGK
ncbi:glycosyltransferase [Latilactobacillus curvatus]